MSLTFWPDCASLAPMEDPPGRNAMYVLAAIGIVIGAVFSKLPKVPWWLVIIGAIVGGAAGVYALDGAFSDFVLGAGAGALGPFLFASLVDGVKRWINRKSEGNSNE